MKKKIRRKLLFCVFSLIMTTGNAQTWSNQFSSTASHQASLYSVGVRAESKSANTSLHSGHSYGVWAAAKNGQYNYGVYGKIDGVGAAIYGTIEDTDTIEHFSDSPYDNRYAGYFWGPVQTYGNLNVVGSIYHDITTGVDSFGPESKGMLLSPESLYKQLRKLSVAAYKKDEGVCYTLTAENLEAVFPGMVHEIGNKNKGYDVYDLVPILVQTINELSIRVEKLEQLLNKEK